MKLNLPMFFPDATNAKIRAVSNSQLKQIKVDGVVVNAYHLLREKLISRIAKKGGIHKFMNFSRPIISDSGGFQVMSLIHNHPELGRILEDGAEFNLDNKKIMLTPEKCIQLQMKIDSDIVMCLDDCTKPEASFKEQEKSVARTISWAGRCKNEFIRLTRNKKNRPMLFAIVQGGESKKLRSICARELIKIGFDGYSFGGWPMRDGKLLTGILKYVADLMPKDKPKYAMGIGKPKDIIYCVKLDYNMFDCVIPTRDARHRRLYVWKNKKGLKYDLLYIRGKHNKSKQKVSKYCDCLCCKKSNLGQLYKYFKEKNEKFASLASIHNLRFYSQLMEKLRKKR